MGAGDLNWVKEIDLTGVNYFPYDIIPRHQSVKELDITKEKPMKADLLMCLWVLNHMSDEDQQKALINIIKSRSIYILMTLRVGQLLPGLNIVESLTLNPEKKDLLIMYRNG